MVRATTHARDAAPRWRGRLPRAARRAPARAVARRWRRAAGPRRRARPRALLPGRPQPARRASRARSGSCARCCSSASPGSNERALGYAVRMNLPLVMVPTRGPLVVPSRLALHAGRALDRRALAGRPEELVRSHLAAFGPATATDMQTWSGVGGHRRGASRACATSSRSCKHGPAHALRRPRRAAPGRGRRPRRPGCCPSSTAAARAQGPHADRSPTSSAATRHEEPAREGDVPRRRLRGRELEHGAQGRHGDADARAVRAARARRCATSSRRRPRRCCAFAEEDAEERASSSAA